MLVTDPLTHASSLSSFLVNFYLLLSTRVIFAISISATFTGWSIKMYLCDNICAWVSVWLHFHYFTCLNIIIILLTVVSCILVFILFFILPVPPSPFIDVVYVSISIIPSFIVLIRLCWFNSQHLSFFPLLCDCLSSLHWSTCFFFLCFFLSAQFDIYIPLYYSYSLALYNLQRQHVLSEIDYINFNQSSWWKQAFFYVNG